MVHCCCLPFPIFCSLCTLGDEGVGENNAQAVHKCLDQVAIRTDGGTLLAQDRRPELAARATCRPCRSGISGALDKMQASETRELGTKWPDFSPLSSYLFGPGGARVSTSERDRICEPRAKERRGRDREGPELLGLSGKVGVEISPFTRLREGKSYEKWGRRQGSQASLLGIYWPGQPSVRWPPSACA